MLDRRIDSGGESKQGEDVVLGGREGGEMAQGEVRRAHDGQGDVLEGGQQELGGRTPGGAGGIARVEAWCYGSCYQVQSKRLISAGIDLPWPRQPSKSTEFGWRRLFHAV